jgi:hypothetical protein
MTYPWHKHPLAGQVDMFRYWEPAPQETHEEAIRRMGEDHPLDKQVGGDHYKNMAIQPIEFIMANNLSFCVGNIVKYACRFDKKGQALQDLEKVIHYAQILIEQEKEKTPLGF